MQAQGMSDHPTGHDAHADRHANGDHDRSSGLGCAVDGDWDERYSVREQIWSGEPNGALVAEVAGMAPGTAMDVGCGEGADAVWLTKHGWDVTAIDVSSVAVERSRVHAEAAGVQVTFEALSLLDAAAAGRTFDLVSAQYPSLEKTPGNDAERALIDAVAPGGLLVVVHHADIDRERALEHGFDPDDYLTPAGVAALLQDDWHIETLERRPRAISGGGGAHHAVDIVLLARREALV